jgi:hypothetical protein
MKRKKLGYHERNFFKNHRLFTENIMKNKGVIKELYFWHFELRITDKKIGDVFDISSFKNHKIAHEYGMELMKKIIKTRNYKFIGWFDDMLKKLNLGEQWFIPLMNFIACGYYCPPKELTIRTIRDENHNKVLLELSKNTSRNDLMNNWKIIEIELFKLKNERKIRMPRSFFKNLSEQIDAFGKKGVYYDSVAEKKSRENDLDVLYKIARDEETAELIEKNPKKALNRYRINKHRLKDYIK